jgi:hypothetical protein
MVLSVSDRERVVGVGLAGLFGCDEPVARHEAHRVEHARIADVARGELASDHALAGLGEVGHGRSVT